MILEGTTGLSVWGHIVVTAVLTHVTIASVTIYLHRHQAHHALTLHPAASHFFRFWLWLTTGMVTRQWVAVHRKHHAKCETPEDPHSPQVRGVARVLFGGVGLYRKEASDPETLRRYGQGTPDDPLERRLYARAPGLGPVIMLGVNLLLFGLAGVVIFAVQMLWIPLWAAGVINGIGHYFGYRSYETPDASRNIVPLGFLIGGEELHNNHHAHVTSARLAHGKWELDIGWAYIRALTMLGLARVRHTAPMPSIAANKHAVDADTARAVVRNRCHVLKLYARQVVDPVIREQRHRSTRHHRRLLGRARKLISREYVILDAHKSALLDEVLQNNETLCTVQRFKRDLTALWDRSAVEQGRRVERLKAWCADAEHSSIETLQQFARQLRGYSLVNAS